MSEHFQAAVDHVMSDDDSELGKTKAELAYSLFSLEREIGIAQGVQAQNDALVKALTKLCDEIGNKELHGDGAHDDSCSICRAHAKARKVLRAVVSTPSGGE